MIYELGLRGRVRVKKNGKVVFDSHNDITASFVLSMVKTLIGASSVYGGHFAMPSTASVKLEYNGTPVTSIALSHVSFTEETVSGIEKTRVAFSFSDASRTKYEFQRLSMWTAVPTTLLLHVSDAQLQSPLYKNPQDVVQVDWIVEMDSGQPFSYISNYLKRHQSTYCQSSCSIPSVTQNMQYGYSAFNTAFALLLVPNIVQVAKNIKTPLTNFLTSVFSTSGEVEPQGITKILCVDICNCTYDTISVSGSVSEFVGDDYVYVAFNFDNTCPSGSYLIPISTIRVGQVNIDLALFAVPSTTSGASAFLIKIPYGKMTLKNLFTHQGE